MPASSCHCAASTRICGMRAVSTGPRAANARTIIRLQRRCCVVKRGLRPTAYWGTAAPGSPSQPPPASNTTTGSAAEQSDPGAAAGSDAPYGWTPAAPEWGPSPEWGEYYHPGDWGEPGVSQAAGGMPAAGDPAAGAQGPDSTGPAAQQQQQQEPFSFTADSTMGNMPPGSTGYSDFGGTPPPYNPGMAPPPVFPSDITVITPRDVEALIPLSPSVEQSRYYSPKTMSERLVQVLGSFGMSVALSKTAVLAGPALLYPVWGPWIRAGIRNLEMHLREYKSVGLWRAEVLSVNITTIPYAYARTGRPPPSVGQASLGDTISIVIGDPWEGGARAQLTFPYLPGCEDIVEGEPGELLVLCRNDTFTNFKVVREVYLPQTGMWLSEYPFINREVFLDISLAIERSRQSQAPPGAPGGFPAGDNGFAAEGGSGAYGTPWEDPVASYPAAAAAAAGSGGYGYSMGAGIEYGAGMPPPPPGMGMGPGSMSPGYADSGRFGEAFPDEPGFRVSEFAGSSSMSGSMGGYGRWGPNSFAVAPAGPIVVVEPTPLEEDGSAMGSSSSGSSNGSSSLGVEAGSASRSAADAAAGAEEQAGRSSSSGVVGVEASSSGQEAVYGQEAVPAPSTAATASSSSSSNGASWAAGGSTWTAAAAAAGTSPSGRQAYGAGASGQGWPLPSWQQQQQQQQGWQPSGAYPGAQQGWGASGGSVQQPAVDPAWWAGDRSAPTYTAGEQQQQGLWGRPGDAYDAGAPSSSSSWLETGAAYGGSSSSGVTDRFDPAATVADEWNKAWAAATASRGGPGASSSSTNSTGQPRPYAQPAASAGQQSAGGPNGQPKEVFEGGVDQQQSDAAAGASAASAYTMVGSKGSHL